MPAFLLLELGKYATLLGVLWITGRCAERGCLRVNDTRKINHFVLFGWQFALRDPATFAGAGLGWQLLDALLTVLVVAGLFLRPLRTRFAPLATMFAAYDRPEDRPHTLRWITWQLVLSLAVALPLQLAFVRLGHPEGLLILLIVNGLGDGLAEPVGVRFGRHRYAVRAWGSPRLYTRSLEGSACVYGAACLALLLQAQAFSTAQWIAALLLLPPAVTLAEARAPHTLDAPLIYAVGGVVLLAVLTLF